MLRTGQPARRGSTSRAIPSGVISTGMPQSCWYRWHAACSGTSPERGVPVAGGGLDADVQHPGRQRRVEPQRPCADRCRGRPRTAAGRAGSPTPTATWGRPTGRPASGRSGHEVDLESEVVGADDGRWASGAVHLPAHLDRLAREPDADEPVRRRLDHDQQRLRAAEVDHDVGRLGEAVGERGDGARRRVEPAHRAVVGVRDRDAAVGQHGHAERVLQPGDVGRAVDVAELEQARPRPGSRATGRRGASASSRSAELSESATHTPSAPAASPDGCESHAVATRPVAQPLLGGAGHRGRRRRGRRAGRPTTAGGCRPSPRAACRGRRRAATR